MPKGVYERKPRQIEIRKAIVKDGCTLIVLGNGGYSTIDLKNTWVEKYKWWKGRDGYAYTSRGGKNFTLHRLIAQTPKNMSTDHINGDKLDNRTANLRVCTHAQNCRNQKLKTSNTSGYKGVYWNKDVSKWVAQIRIDGKVTSLGLFNDIKEAAKVYDKTARIHHGEFARLNHGA